MAGLVVRLVAGSPGRGDVADPLVDVVLGSSPGLNGLWQAEGGGTIGPWLLVRCQGMRKPRSSQLRGL